MPNAAPIQSSFATGEISPLMLGNITAPRVKAALEKCLNYIPTIQGGLIRRPGSYFVGSVKDYTKKSRLIPFEFSTTQAYVIELCDQFLRFYRNNAPVLEATKAITAITKANPAVVTSIAHGFSNGDHVEIASVSGMTQVNARRFKVANVATDTFELHDLFGSNINSTGYSTYTSGGTVARVYTVAAPWLEADLYQLKFTQSADILYVTHPSYAPRKISRTGHTAWTVTTIAFVDGPYLGIAQKSDGTFDTTITVTPSASSGTITVTASAALFVSTDVGRLIRIKETTQWNYGTITAYSSSTSVTVSLTGTLTATTASTHWRLGLWSDTTGYPSVVVFHEDRLWFAGTLNFPQRLDGSNSSDYENFAPSTANATEVIADSSALDFSLNANDVNVIRWMASDEKGLLIGTVGGEWVLRPSSLAEAITPTNVAAKRASAFGSANIQPVVVGKAAMYIQRAGKKLRELTYYYDVDGFQANDMTLLSEHITGPGITQLAYQKEPQSIIWAVRSDGVLAGMTYQRDIESLKAGWARQIVGGPSDAANSNAIVESVACIPSADGSRDELYVIVKRWVNGHAVRYVEYITPIFDDLTDQQDAFFVDCGLTYDSPLTVSGATKANPVVITATAHGFSNGDHVRFLEVLGMDDINNVTYIVANKATDAFELHDLNGNAVDGTAFGTYVSGGKVRKLVTSISGLWHLEGETLDVLADGAVLPAVTVSSGTVTITVSSAVVQIGYNIQADGQLLRLDAGSANGTSMGKTRRTHRVGFMLHRTLGFKFGTDFDTLDEVTFRTSADLMSRAPALFTGILSESLTAEYDFDNKICWRQDQPLPGLILAVMPQLVTNDRI